MDILELSSWLIIYLNFFPKALNIVLQASNIKQSWYSLQLIAQVQHLTVCQDNPKIDRIFYKHARHT